jgi:hypothetical protein
MTHSSCAHDTIKTTCILHISHNNESQFSHDQASVQKDDEHSHSHSFRVNLAWKFDCVNCHAITCKCMTKDIPSSHAPQTDLRIVVSKMPRIARGQEHITFRSSKYSCMYGFKVDPAKCLKQIDSFLKKCTDDEQPGDIEYLDTVKSFDSSSTSYVIPEHHPICIIFTSSSVDNRDFNRKGVQKVAMVLYQDDRTDNGVATHTESIQYPLHRQARIICGLFDNRTAARSLSGCKPNRLHWTEFSRQVEHSQQLITKKIDILKRIQDCYETQVHRHIDDMSNLHRWNCKNINLHHSLTADLQTEIDALCSSTTKHLDVILNTRLHDGIQQLERILPNHLFTHMKQVIDKYRDIQLRVSWDRVHEYDTNRSDIVNIRAWYVGLRAIETFMEHVVSHKKNHDYLDRYIYKSYQYQLHQILANNTRNSIELDEDVFTQVQNLLTELDDYTLLHEKIQSDDESDTDRSLLPFIESTSHHEMMSMACVQGILTQNCVDSHMKDTRLRNCCSGMHYHHAKHSENERHSTAVLTFCDMLEVDVQNRILHVSLRDKVRDVLYKSQMRGEIPGIRILPEDIECLDIFDSSTRPLADYAIFGKSAEAPDDILYKFFKSPKDMQTGYNHEVIAEWITLRRHEISRYHDTQYVTNDQRLI